MYAYGGFMLMYDRNQHNIVKQLLLLLSCQTMSNSLRPHGPQHARPPIAIFWRSPKFTPIESVTSSNHLNLCCPLISLFCILIYFIFNCKAVTLQLKIKFKNTQKRQFQPSVLTATTKTQAIWFPNHSSWPMK